MQLAQRTISRVRVNVLNIPSCEIANTPSIRPIPLNINAIMKNNTKTNRNVIIEIGKTIRAKIKKMVKGNATKIKFVVKIPNNKLKRLKGATIIAGKVFQYFSRLSCNGNWTIILFKRNMLIAKN